MTRSSTAGGRGVPDETPDRPTSSARMGGAGRQARGAMERPLSDGELLAEIGRELRSVYNDLFREPVPERLVTIIEKLERREKDPERSDPSRGTPSRGERHGTR